MFEQARTNIRVVKKGCRTCQAPVNASLSVTYGPASVPSLIVIASCDARLDGSGFPQGSVPGHKYGNARAPITTTETTRPTRQFPITPKNSLACPLSRFESYREYVGNAEDAHKILVRNSVPPQSKGSSRGCIRLVVETPLEAHI